MYYKKHGMNLTRRNVLTLVVCAALIMVKNRHSGVEREWECTWDEQKEWEVQVHGKSGKVQRGGEEWKIQIQ